MESVTVSKLKKLLKRRCHIILPLLAFTRNKFSIILSFEKLPVKTVGHDTWPKVKPVNALMHFSILFF